jgi:6-phosphogluconolactonase (cycloisomerase 2 family)
MTTRNTFLRHKGIILILALALAASGGGDAMAHSKSRDKHHSDRGRDHERGKHHSDRGKHRGPGAVYTLTNATGGNAVKVFERGHDGSLAPAGEYPTGGTGTGGGLGNQGAVVLDGRRLFAVNAGSDSISSFEVKHDRLELVDVEPSGGDRPISVTVHRGLAYVLNAGGSGGISGFHVSHSGELRPLAGSLHPLSGDAVDPAQISFDPEGESLVVTEKATNLIDVFDLDERTGRVDDLDTHASAGMTPFGFGFRGEEHLIVSEAFGGAPDASAVSSYELDDGDVDVITPSVRTTETAACWIVVTGDGRHTYTTNTGSASISGYRISRDGRLTLLDADGKTGVTGAGPIDMALSEGSRFLYSLNAGADSISGFRVERDGSLTSVGEVAGVPDGATGLAAR